MSQELQRRLLAPYGWEERFLLEEIVGTGAAGQVWRAKEPKTNRCVALKFLAAHCLGDVSALARMEGEGQTLQRLRDAGQHPNVVSVLDFAVTEDQACLVMDYIPGQTLAEVMTDGGLAFEKTVRWLASIARACGWFHQLGVVHRDLKPQNILIHDATGEPVIIDFSIAKDEELMTLTMTNQALGTAAYMAPEQFGRIKSGITPAADVYALGVIIYERLTRVRPHPGDFHHIMQRHSDEVRPASPSALNPTVPRDLECICLKALSHNPTDRYADGSAMAEDLEHFLVGEPVKARPASRLVHWAKQARRKPALSAALAACLVLAGFALWSLQSAAHLSRQRAHEARLAELLQTQTWTRTQLQEAEAHLTALAVGNPTKADELRESVVDDVVRDFENALLQPVLVPADHAWLRDAALPWLFHQKHPQASDLQAHYTQRLGRWDTLLHLQPPFMDMQGLFAKAATEVNGATLRPRFDPEAKTDLNAEPPTIRVKDDLSNPVEAVFTFQAEAKDFRRLRLHSFFQKQTADVFLCRARDTPETALSQISTSSTAIHSESFVLYLTRGKTIEAVCHIPDQALLAQPFTLRLRVENRRMDAVLNEGWHLHLDDLFVFSSSQGGNILEIQWPPCLSLLSLELRSRNQPSGALMQLADRLFSENKIQEARLLYQAMPSHAATSAETTYKLARCDEAQGQLENARSLWAKVSDGQPSLWNELSTYKLWLHTARLHGTDAARSWLHRLPERLCPQLRSTISGDDQQHIAALYGKLGRGFQALRRDPEAALDALRAFRAGNILAPKTAAAVLSALHFSQLDTQAATLAKEALSQPQRWLPEPSCLMPSIASLDLWTRFTPSESSPDLSEAMEAWARVHPGQPSITAIVLQEKGRRHARAGSFEAALADTHRANAIQETDPRLRVSGLLTEGWLLQQMQRHEEAQEKWRSALAEAERVGKKIGHYQHSLPLLHSVGRSWTPSVITQYLTGLITAEQDSVVLQKLLPSFISDDALCASLNALIDTERGQALLRHHALRTLPARDLIQQTYTLLLEHYLLSAAFPTPASAAQRTHIQQSSQRLIEAAAALGKTDVKNLLTYLQIWLTTPPQPQMPELPEGIENDLKQLLAQRYRHLGKVEAGHLIGR